MKPTRIAHPEWMQERCERVQESARIYLAGHMPEPVAAFCLATPAHSLLRAIYGGSWRVAWACLWYALVQTVGAMEPLWLFRWRHRAELELDEQLEREAETWLADKEGNAP